MRRGDVVLILGPDEIGKPRPAVIVQADTLGPKTTAVILCPISSAEADTPHIRPAITPDETNGLRAPSHIMTEKIIALRRDRVRTVIGRLSEPDLLRLDEALLLVLGLLRP